MAKQLKAVIADDLLTEYVQRLQRTSACASTKPPRAATGGGGDQ
ncbi:MAG: hypothetical protein U1E30_05105 [Rhodoblastus sp.]